MKNNSKKLLCLFLAVIMMLSVFASFSAVADEPPEEPETSESETTTTTTTTTITTTTTTTAKPTTTKPTTSPHPANGWSKDKKRYYVKNKHVTGFQTIKKKRYYFDTKTGIKAVGVKKIGKYYYGFGSNGVMLFGWQDIGGARYRFNLKTGRALIGLNQIGKYKYYFSSDGKMQTGWVKIKKKTYFFWRKTKKKGRAMTGVATIDGVTYRFNKDGTLAGKVSDLSDAMTVKANTYDSPTKYLILVNKKTYKVGIYKGKKGEWTRVKYYDCTLGAKDTPTPSGNFLMNVYQGRPYRQRYFDSGDVRVFYATRVVRGINFHSVTYKQLSEPTKLVDGRLGMNLSHGCIRLKLEHAKWIYDNIPKNTRCVIY